MMLNESIKEAIGYTESSLFSLPHYSRYYINLQTSSKLLNSPDYSYKFIQACYLL